MPNYTHEETEIRRRLRKNSDWDLLQHYELLSGPLVGHAREGKEREGYELNLRIAREECERRGLI
jgi:hypothetical protein